MHTGACLCGAVRFEVQGELAPPDACHCSQCRRQSGHYWASTNVPREALTIHGAERLTWYASSAEVRRGFCSVCGSFLFWDPVKHGVIAVAMGALDPPTGVRLAVHIFVAEKGDYYELGDEVVQREGY